MKTLLLAIFLNLAFFVTATNAQEVNPCPTMPAGFICLSREAAQAALEAGDKAKALEVELKAMQAAFALQKDALEKMRIEFASVSGENAILKQIQVADRALMTVLVQNTKKKRNALITIF